MKPRSAAAVLLILAVPLALLLTQPATATAESFRISSETLVRVFERDTTKGTDEQVIPAYEYLRLDFGQLDEHGLSLHLYGWGRNEFADSEFYEDDAAGELLYGYLQYTRAESNLDLRLGRQHIFAGIANESVDGLSVATDLGPFFMKKGGIQKHLPHQVRRLNKKTLKGGGYDCFPPSGSAHGQRAALLIG